MREAIQESGVNWVLGAMRLSSLSVLSAYAIGMALVESSVVVYLRKMMVDVWIENPSRILVEQAFHRSGVYHLEQIREAATIVMIVCIAWLSGTSVRARAAAFFWVFGLWDLFYYGFLYAILAWPKGLLTMDVLFLIPGPWIAPVGVPVATSIGFLMVGLYLWPFSNSRPMKREDVS